MNIPYVKTGESEIDLLFVEELFSSSEFQSWLLKKLNIVESHKFIGAWKSFIGKYGECDIVAEFMVSDQRVIILIENKIYAPEQLDQAERYHKTGKHLIDNERKGRYITCLISPRIYFREDAPMNKYEHKISYEELLEWFQKQGNSERIQFKQMIIKNGIERARTGYKRNTDENTDRFYHYYEELVRETHPELEYRKPRAVASGNSWIRFNPNILPSKVTIIHKGKYGYVDLQISGMDIEKFSNKYKSKLKDNMSIHLTGKSISVRIVVPIILDIERIEEPKKYREEILIALNSAGQLLEWYLEFLQAT